MAENIPSVGLDEESDEKFDYMKFVEDLDNFMTSRFVSEELPQLVKLYEYQGFVPSEVINTVKEKLNDEEIIRLIRLALLHGTKLNKIKKRVSSDEAIFIDEVLKKLTIKDSLGSVPSRSVITLNRIMSAFAPETCRVASSLDKATIDMEKICPGYPACMQTQAFAALTPMDLSPHERQKLAKCHLLHQYHLGKKVTCDSEKKLLLKSVKFFQNGVGNQLYHNDQRLNLCREFEIVTTEGTTPLNVNKGSAMFDDLCSAILKKHIDPFTFKVDIDLVNKMR